MITDQRLLSALKGLDYTNDEIAAMSPEQRFSAYCQWTFGDPLWGDILTRIQLACKG